MLSVVLCLWLGRMSRWSKSPTLATLQMLQRNMLRGSSVVPSLGLTLSWKTSGGFSRDSSSHFFCETSSASLTQGLLLPDAIFTYLPYAAFYFALWLLIEERLPSLFNYRRKHTKLVPSQSSILISTNLSLLCSVTGRWLKWSLVPFSFGIL